MGALTWPLIGVDIVWIVAVIVAGVRRAVRTRFLLVSVSGWLVSMVIATEAQPAELGLPVGLLVGAWGAVGIALATRRGVTFTVMPDKVYWQDDERLPTLENLLLLFMLACGCFAIVALAIHG
jgi:hypothetical protein